MPQTIILSAVLHSHQAKLCCGRGSQWFYMDFIFSLFRTCSTTSFYFISSQVKKTAALGTQTRLRTVPSFQTFQSFA